MKYNLSAIKDSRGTLTVIESKKHIPFSIKRVFYIYGIQEGQDRGGHAHKKLHQFVIPVAGSFTLTLDNGTEKSEYLLNNPAIGVHIHPMVWGELSNFSPDAVCMVLASDYYDESDYYRNYEDFLDAIVCGRRKRKC